MGERGRKGTVLATAVLAVLAVTAAFVSSSGSAATVGSATAQHPPTGSALGQPPQPCAPGFVPAVGLLKGSGCLIQSALAGFQISPNVVHVGQRITGTVLPGAKTDRWNWTAFEQAFGVTGKHARCSSHQTSCTVTAGAALSGARWRVFSMAIEVPINGGGFEGGVSSDYFTVDDTLYELGGLVSDSTNRLGQPLGVGDNDVQVTGNGINAIQKTSPLGRYAFALPPGHYTVRVLGPLAERSLPSHYTVTLVRNVGNANFELNAKDHVAIGVEPLGSGPTAGNATILAGASAATITTSITNPNGNPRSIEIETSPPQAPKAVFCTIGQLVYPQLDPTGQPTLLSPFVAQTKPLGTGITTMYAGNAGGAYPLNEVEVLGHNGAGASSSLVLAATPRQSLQSVSQNVYNAVAALRSQPRATASILGIGVPSTATSPAQITAARSAEQEVLLAFLDAHFSQVGVDFGPVFTDGVGGGPGAAGIEFYDGQNDVVLDTGTAESIAGAALSGQPLPAPDQALPALSDYQAAYGPVMQGHLTPDPSDVLTYFGWPYPPLSADGILDARFSDNCVRPDTQQLRVEVDGPAQALFTNSYGQRFGFTATGAPESAATGYAFAAPSGQARTFILPIDTYGVALAATGPGTVHVSLFAPGPSAEITQVFTLTVKRGQKGSLTVDGSGAPGPLQFAGQSYPATTGLGLTLSASAPAPKSGPRTLIVHVRDAVGRPVPGAVVTVTQGTQVGIQGATNNAGVVQLAPAGMGVGLVTIGAAAAAALPARLVYRVAPAALKSAGTGAGHQGQPHRGGGGAAGAGAKGAAGGRRTTSRSRPTASTRRTRR